MPSPFPGMDPYLEKHWGDVHTSLIIYARDQLQAALPGELRARAEERVTVDAPLEDPRTFIPDVHIHEQIGAKARRSRAGLGSIAVAEPRIIVTHDDVTEGFIEIRDASSGHRVVTVIEVLSPTNKLPGRAREKYLRKCEELYEGNVNLVEIDLTRAGARPFPFAASILSPAERTAYHAWVRRGGSIKIELYSFSLREQLPAIRIPLRATDQDVPLDLQPLIDKCYANGSYEGDLDYQHACEPPLEPADGKWADALLRKAGHRKASRNGHRKPRRR